MYSREVRRGSWRRNSHVGLCLLIPLHAQRSLAAKLQSLFIPPATKQLKWHCLLFAVQHAWPGLCGWVQVEELAGEYSRGIRLNETFAMLAGGNIRTESLLIQLKQKVGESKRRRRHSVGPYKQQVSLLIQLKQKVMRGQAHM